MDEQFAKSVERYMEIDEALEAAAAKVKLLKAEQKTLSSSIMRTMASQNWKKCETADANLLLSVSVAQKSLSVGLIKGVLEASVGASQAAVVMDALKSARKKGAGERERLKRVKHRKKAI